MKLAQRDRPAAPPPQDSWLNLLSVEQAQSDCARAVRGGKAVRRGEDEPIDKNLSCVGPYGWRLDPKPRRLNRHKAIEHALSGAAKLCGAGRMEEARAVYTRVLEIAPQALAAIIASLRLLAAIIARLRLRGVIPP